jgi:UDP-N-acetylmuramoyl-tripeptide--D-alanyl-D-alanine ligase
MRLIKKIFFSLKRPKIIFIDGKGAGSTKEAIFQALKDFLKIKKISILPFSFEKDEILILENFKDFEFLMENSSLPILILTHFTDIPPEQISFASEEREIVKLKDLAKRMPIFSYLVLNFDDETVREIKEISKAHSITFGFGQNADLKASDIKLNMGTNFKLHHNKTILPIWLERIFGKEQIYSALAALSVAKILKLNLVDVSLALKNYKLPPGKMNLIEGIKNSWILDDSQSATPFSMIEALQILGKLNWPKRKIAVLGDVVGIGKYTIEAHETIGEYVVKNANFLFTFGQRAKFIAKGAFEKGMEENKIFQFEKIEDGKEKLKEEIKEGDLILVDGSKEMEMSKIVEEIKARSF